MIIHRNGQITFKNDNFPKEKVVGSVIELSPKGHFKLAQELIKIWFENNVSVIQLIENRKTFFDMYSSIDQANLIVILHYR